MPSVKLPYRDGEAVMTVDGDKLSISVTPLAPTPPPWNWPKPLTGIFVTPNGSFSGTGAINNPMSLERALGISGPGQQIWLRAGTYNPTQTLSPKLVGVAGNPWLISAYPGEDVTLNFATGSRHGILFNAPTAAFQEWRNIRFTDLSAGPGGTVIYDLLKFDRGMNIGFIHCQFDNCKRTGILTNGTAGNLWFYGCSIFNNGVDTQFDHGVYGKSLSGTLTFENCFVLNNSGHQLHFYNSSTGMEEGIRGVEAFDNSIFTYGEPSDRPILFQDSGPHAEARDCSAIGNRCYNQFPGADATDQDRSSLKIVNGVNSRIEGNCVWGGDVVSQGGSAVLLNNRTAPAGLWSSLEIWSRKSKYDEGIVHVTIWNPAKLLAVNVDLGTILPACHYEIRAASSPQKVCATGNYSGSGPIPFPTSGLVYEPQVRTGGFNWPGDARANGYIVRRIP